MVSWLTVPSGRVFEGSPGASSLGAVRALDGGVHDSAEAAAEARDILALRVGSADPVRPFGLVVEVDRC